jgi:hypothetical protein
MACAVAWVRGCGLVALILTPFPRSRLAGKILEAQNPTGGRNLPSAQSTPPPWRETPRDQWPGELCGLLCAGVPHWCAKSVAPAHSPLVALGRILDCTVRCPLARQLLAPLEVRASPRRPTSDANLDSRVTNLDAEAPRPKPSQLLFALSHQLPSKSRLENTAGRPLT